MIVRNIPKITIYCSICRDEAFFVGSSHSAAENAAEDMGWWLGDGRIDTELCPDCRRQVEGEMNESHSTNN